jgi:hypothetical protein
MVALLFAAFPIVASASGCYSYEDTHASLTGTLTRVHIETLSQGKQPHLVTVAQWWLFTSKPFCVTGDTANGDIVVKGATNVQLLPMHNESKLSPLIGKRVTVVGPFMATLIPHYHPYLIKQVVSVSVSEHAEP